MNETKVSQTQLVIEYIEEFGSITALEAVRDLCVYRLSARIADAKKRGYVIDAKMEPVLNRRGKTSRIARYSIRADGE